jgi:hypothetical protein
VVCFAINNKVVQDLFSLLNNKSKFLLKEKMRKNLSGFYFGDFKNGQENYVQKKFVQNRFGKKYFFSETINFSMKKRK